VFELISYLDLEYLLIKCLNNKSVRSWQWTEFLFSTTSGVTAAQRSGP
jgi:hypothetical protein